MAFIQYDINDSVAVITLNRPERHNAQNREFLEELDAAWDRAAADPAAKVIVLRANGKNFSSGHDLTASPDARQQWYDEVDEVGFQNVYNFESNHYLGFTRKWRDISKPSIAAVQGGCIAAGLMLCWPCDLILAADNAYFSDPVVLMGIGGVEYHGHTWELGARKAKEMLFTGEPIYAKEAEKLGMVNRVIPLQELDEQTMALAQKIAAQPAFALQMAKRAVNKTLEILGQYAATQAVFDSHWLGHANVVAQIRWPVLKGLDKMKKKKPAD